MRRKNTAFPEMTLVRVVESDLGRLQPRIYRRLDLLVGNSSYLLYLMTFCVKAAISCRLTALLYQDMLDVFEVFHTLLAIGPLAYISNVCVLVAFPLFAYFIFLVTPVPDFLILLKKLCIAINETLVSQGGHASVLECIKAEDLHISLSRTVYLKVFQIDRFIASLFKSLHTSEPFRFSFQNAPSSFVNDERTRSFLGLEVARGHRKVCSPSACWKDVRQLTIGVV